MQEIDRRRSTRTYGWLAAVLALLVVAPAFGAGATATADTDSAAPTQEATSATQPLSTGPDGSPQTSVEASGLTWQLLSHEYCLDRFGTTCPNGATSADPCPYASPAGKPCSVPFDRCWSVLSAYWADEYRCL